MSIVQHEMFRRPDQLERWTYHGGFHISRFLRIRDEWLQIKRKEIKKKLKTITNSSIHTCSESERFGVQGQELISG